MSDANGPGSDNSASGPFPVYTIGHSTRTLDEFRSLLSREGIQLVCDIRTYPMSRRYPHFNGEPLETALRAEAVEYRHIPALGGRRTPRKDSRNSAWTNAGFRGYADHMETDEFRAALSGLISESRSTRLVIMCAEAVPWRCHRNLVSDALVAAGKAVRHIMDAKSTDHSLTKFASVVDGHVSYRSNDPEPDLFSTNEDS